MVLKKTLAARAIALAAMGGAVSVAGAATVTITFSDFGSIGGGDLNIAGAIAARDAFIGVQPPIVSENFEGFEACDGTNSATCESGTVATGVGTFTGIGPAPASGGGSQVDPLGEIVVRTSTPSPFGRYDVDGGANWLDSNDLKGVNWEIPGASGLPMLRKLAFFLTDVDDVGSFDFAITATGSEVTSTIVGGSTPSSGLPDGKLHLVTMAFSEYLSDLNIEMLNGTGDGFGIDGVRVAAVPLPAGGLLLLGALGGLGVVRMRKRKMAA